MSLETVGKLVAQYSSSPLEKQKKIDTTEPEQAMVRTMFNWLMLGMIVIGVGIAMLVVNKYFDLGKWFSLCLPLYCSEALPLQPPACSMPSGKA